MGPGEQTDRHPNVGRSCDLGSIHAQDRLRKGGGSEMVPVKAISAVTVERDGFRQLVKVICSGNTIDFRVGRGEADGIKALLTQLMVGTHPAQQASHEPSASFCSSVASANRSGSRRSRCHLTSPGDFDLPARVRAERSAVRDHDSRAPRRPRRARSAGDG